jgi:DNA-binding MarR family transcriptional regulator
VLATRIGTTRQAVSQLARAVETAGLVERVPHPTEGRSGVVRHTEAGRRILLDALDVMTAIEREYASAIGEAGVGELTQLLGEIDPSGRLDQPG